MPFFPHPKRRVCKRLAAAATLFLCSFFAGNVLAHTISSFSSLSTDFLPVSASCENWGLSFQQEGKPPVANATSDYLKQFQAHYIADTTESVLYLTFDAGYENGNTEAILDALKKHHAPAAFFLVGNYLETSPDLVKRMMAEGHTVGNHTWHHPDMSKIADQSSFSEELSRLEQKYQEITGTHPNGGGIPIYASYTSEKPKTDSDDKPLGTTRGDGTFRLVFKTTPPPYLYFYGDKKSYAIDSTTTEINF